MRSLSSRRVSLLFRCLGSLVTLPIIAILAGCGSSSAPPPLTISLIAVTPANPSLAAGATQQLKATGTYNNGTTADISSQVSWSSSNTGVATVSASGMLSAVAAGSSTITASMNGVNGTTSLTVTAPGSGKTLSSIAITPANATFVVGGTQQFTATGSYSDGSTADLTATATWSVTNTGVATITAAGLATGVSAGTASVSAVAQGVTGTASFTVAPSASPTLVSIAVTPAAPSITVGATQQFTATGTYSDNSTANISSTVTWSVTTPSVASISNTGLATGVAAGSTPVKATLSGITGSTTLTVTAATKTITSIAVTPADASIATTKTQQYTATATYSDKSTADITSTATWSSSNTAVATIAANGLATGVAAGSTTISAKQSNITGSTSLTVTTTVAGSVNVTTWHFDNNRSGLNPSETSLTPTNVTASTFGKLFSYQVDGYVYAQPLIVTNLTIGGAKHNVLFVATENDSVYAFDADTYGTGAPLWKVSLLQTGESPLTGAAIKPVLGVTSTPVIDTATNTLYVVSTQKPATAAASYRLSALDLTTGAQKLGGPVTVEASVPGTGAGSVGGVMTLTTSCVQRAALLEANNTIYIGFGSCHTGWLLAYDATTLTQVGVFNSSPNISGEGTYGGAGGVWMGGGGPVADSAGNVYIVTGNGPWNGNDAMADSIIKFNAKLGVLDYFTPDSYAYENCADADLASGGLMMIPGTTELLGGGKIGKLFLVNSANMGKESTGDTGATQAIWFDATTPYSASCTDASGTHTTQINPFEIFGTAAYFNGAAYIGDTPTGASAPAGVRQFTYNGTLTAGSISAPAFQQNTRGITPFISANGTNNGILWMIDQGQPIQNTGGNTPTAAVLRAYDPAHFPTELYNSSTNAADAAGYAIKFSSPVVANGKVYIGTGHDLNATAPTGEIDVYGLK
ncbi:hypothetical protein DYQ86_20910 [Acidobacteria bacterium AB60]|nr:hypothetical protein DYQ86_20910 [Acidobacteria bacterium AB60]